MESLLRADGPDRAKAVFRALRDYLTDANVIVEEATLNTPYRNTIPLAQQPAYPGDIGIEERIENILRWNAMAMVLRGYDSGTGVGGHIGTYASAATMLEVGLHHFFRNRSAGLRRRPGHHPGARRAGHLRAGLPRGPADRDAARPFPPRAAARRRAVVLPAPAQHAGVLAGALRLDGPVHAERHLPGALREVPGEPRPEAGQRRQGLGLHRRRRGRRAGGARHHQHRGARTARQPDHGRELQPAAPRRAGAGQRQDHPGTRAQLPRRRLERHQGDLERRMGPAVCHRPRGRPAGPHGTGRGRRLPDVLGLQRPGSARALGRTTTSASPTSWRCCPTRRSAASAAAATTSARSTRPSSAPRRPRTGPRRS